MKFFQPMADQPLAEINHLLTNFGGSYV